VIIKNEGAKAHWIINMGLHETAWFVLYNRLAWRRFMIKHLGINK